MLKFNRKAYAAKLFPDFLLKFMRFSEQSGQFGGKMVHFLFKWFSIILNLRNANVTPWSQYVILFCDIFKGSYGAVAFLFIQCDGFKGIKSLGDFCYVIKCKFTKRYIMC